MSEFNFKSQICTTREQSERLLALGLKQETADMHHYIWSEGYWDTQACPPRRDSSRYIPAWSLDRLRELIPENIFTGVRNQWHRVMYNGVLTYEEGDDSLVSFREANIYDRCISCIEWLIKEGHIDKKYLKSEFVKVEINTLANKCGFFNGETDINNGYGCNHPEQEEQDETEDERGHRICQGKCLASTCPLGWLDDENMDNDFVQMSRGDALKLGLTDYNVDEVEEK